MHSHIITIGISGGSGSGKTTFAKKLANSLAANTVTHLAQDNYYIDQSQRFDGDGGSVNFDHPSALDFVLMAEHIEQFKNGLPIQMPHYDFATHKRHGHTTELAPSKYLLVDGTMILTYAPLRELMDYSIFISVPEEVRFQRRLNRDVRERGRTPEGVKKQFTTQVSPMHNLFVEPQAQVANFVATMDNVELKLQEILHLL